MFLGEEGFFLVRKILINVYILRDPFLIEIPLTRVNRGVQDISLHRYSWRPSKATLDLSRFFIPFGFFILVGFSLPVSLSFRRFV